MDTPTAVVESSPGRPRVGLVLGAGGTRGCAHAGVVAVLREAGIPIDVVVGASVGSIFGLGVAADVPTERFAQVAWESTSLNMMRFYGGRLSLERRNPIARLLRDTAAGRRFEDLPIPFAVRVTDVATGRPEVISSGPLVPAVQASIALPLISRPVRVGDRWYMDGGMFDTVPVEVARAMGADIVIAVCLGVNYTAPRWMRRRPWTLPLVERMGRASRPPEDGPLDQVRFALRVCAASYRVPEPCSDADIAIWPTFGAIGTNSMTAGPFCFQQGIVAARQALPEIRRMACSAASATA